MKSKKKIILASPEGYEPFDASGVIANIVIRQPDFDIRSMFKKTGIHILKISEVLGLWKPKDSDPYHSLKYSQTYTINLCGVRIGEVEEVSNSTLLLVEEIDEIELKYKYSSNKKERLKVIRRWVSIVSNNLSDLINIYNQIAEEDSEEEKIVIACIANIFGYKTV